MVINGVTPDVRLVVRAELLQETFHFTLTKTVHREGRGVLPFETGARGTNFDTKFDLSKSVSSSTNAPWR